MAERTKTLTTTKVKNKENRNIQKHWLQRYCFYQHENVLTCLICRKNIRVPKKYNIQRHYETHHPDYEQYTGELRKQKIMAMVRCITGEENDFENAPHIDLDSDFLCVVPKQEIDDDCTQAYMSTIDHQPDIDIFDKDGNPHMHLNPNPLACNELKLFGQYVGEKLLSLNPQLQSWTKREICEIIFKAEMKQLQIEAGPDLEENLNCDKDDA